MTRGGRRRVIPPTLADRAQRFAALSGLGVSYDGRSWAPFVADVDLDARVADDDAREAASW